MKNTVKKKKVSTAGSANESIVKQLLQKEETDSLINKISHIGSLVIGLLISLYIGYYYACFSKKLHENNLWFSNIQQVEREISFRTESGLYYSYYKQMVLAPSISDGFYELMHDNKTEHLRTINIIERFNVYQEILLAVIYKSLPLEWQGSIEYIYFYINTIFGLHGIYMVALFCCSWMISGTFMAGVLANAFYIFNNNDMTRFFYTLPLRESFSLPFIFMQFTVLTYYFKKDISKTMHNICLCFVCLFTFCYVLTWQFAQFVLLLQSFAIFGVYVLDFVPGNKVKPLFWIFSLNLSTVCIMQFGNDMLYTSLVASFCVASLILLCIQKDTVKISNGFVKLLKLILRIVFVLCLTFAVNLFIKKITKANSDEHVFKFITSKLGYGAALKQDFDAKLYLCNGGFQYLPLDTFQRLTDGFVFPIYASSIVVFTIILAICFFQKLSHNECVLDSYPEIVFNFIINVFFGAMALSTLRMKFLWLPHMAIIAAGLFSNQLFWKSFLQSLHITSTMNFLIRHSVPVILISLLLFKKYPSHKEQVNNLYEFHDPDTVQLMEWIKSSTPKDASFTGSMQLLAGVKLCTDRHITNHPHYENKFLRQRTKEVYQIYSRKTPAEVYNILKKHGTSYIILENSICYSKKEDNCALTDIIDIDNGLYVPSKAVKNKRFCEAIKLNHASFTKYFKKVFENRTFYLYKVL